MLECTPDSATMSLGSTTTSGLLSLKRLILLLNWIADWVVDCWIVKGCGCRLFGFVID